jgi:hypothetical protein
LAQKAWNQGKGLTHLFERASTWTIEVCWDPGFGFQRLFWYQTSRPLDDQGQVINTLSIN